MAHAKVFVSHSHKDDAFTNRLVADLKGAGATVWVDVADMGAGDFQKRINDVLAGSEYVVLVLSNEALASSWVEQEINAAIRLKHQGHIRDIVPIQATMMDYRTLPPLWGVFNIFDATSDYALALDGVLCALGLTAGGATSSGKSNIPTAATRGEHDAEKRLATYDRALLESPGNMNTWIGKGRALFDLTRYDEALAAYDRALRITDTAPAWSGKGDILRATGQHRKAVAAYDRALAKDHEYRPAWVGKLRSLEALGNRREAAEAARQARVLSFSKRWAGTFAPGE